MAKVSIKSEKITPFGGIFHVREHFSRFVGSLSSVYYDFNTATKQIISEPFCIH